MLEKAKARAQLKRTVRGNVAIGSGFRTGSGSVLWAPRSLTIGNSVHLGSDVRIEVDGVIGDGVLIANSAAIVGKEDHDVAEVGVPIQSARWVGSDPDRLSHPVTVGSDVWIGYGAIVLSGVTIGDSSVIGAGSVVTRDIPSNSIAVGNPAKVVGNRIDPQSFEQHWAELRAKGIRRLVPETGS